jgi:tetratricopeptide (TPR) repeat protein
VDEAIACFRKAIQVDPKLADAHTNLGVALADKGQVDEAIDCYNKALAINPKNAGVHSNLGAVLCDDKRDYDGAIACFQKALSLDPNHALAHCNLGHAFRNQSRFAEALAALKRGHELGTKQRSWAYPSAAWVRNAERMAAVEAHLPAFLKGELQPRDTEQRLGLAGVCKV